MPDDGFLKINSVSSQCLYFIAIGRCLIRRSLIRSSYILFSTTSLMFSRNNSP